MHARASRMAHCGTTTKSTNLDIMFIYIYICSYSDHNIASYIMSYFESTFYVVAMVIDFVVKYSL